MPPFDRFTDNAKDAIRIAHEIASENGVRNVNAYHMLLAVLRADNLVPALFERLDISPGEVEQELLDILEEEIREKTDETFAQPVQVYLTTELAAIIERSMSVAKKMKDEYIGVEHLLLSFYQVDNEAQAVLLEHGMEQKDILRILDDARMAEKRSRTKGEKNGLRTLEKFSRNLTNLAREDKLDPVIGRDEEIMRVIQILSRRTKNNPVLIGEPGVGKTAIAEGLAIRIARGDVPPSLAGKNLYLLDLGFLIAGTKFRGEFEDRVKKIMGEVEKNHDSAILFIDEIHTLIGTGNTDGSLDAANLLKPALARGALRVIGATTLDEYQKHFEKDAALARRFQTVNVPEPSVEDTISILRGLKKKYELYHGVRITDDAIVSAAEFSARYITSRFLPDKAIDVVDEAASSLKISLQNKPDELEVAHRKIMTLEIEKQALHGDSGSNKAEIKRRIGEIELEIGNLRESVHDLELRWENEKSVVKKINDLKELVAQLQLEEEQAEIRGEIARIAEIRHGKVPILEREIETEMRRMKRLQKKEALLCEEVGAEDIARVISRWTHIPINKMLETESAKLAQMEESLTHRVRGQNDAVRKVSDAVRRARTGIADPNRPIGSFIFLGPTGVGKTELTKALAEFLFNDERAMIRVDMSEFMEPHSIAKLIGAPPGYIGYEESGRLTEAVRHRPYSIILFDEIEKAHKEVFNLLLQVLDDGRLTDSKGRVVDFRNTVIIMTSNIGSEHIQKMQNFGFHDSETKSEYETARTAIIDSLKKFFRPEFLNRIDETIVFDALGHGALREIVIKELEETKGSLATRNIFIDFTDRTIDHLVEVGYDPQYGARPLRRLIQSQILNKIARHILDNHGAKKSKMTVDIVKGEIAVNVKSSLRKKVAKKAVATGK